MIVAAIDISSSTWSVPNYKEDIYAVLSKLTPPVRVIHWNDGVSADKIYEEINSGMVNFVPAGFTSPECFFQCLKTSDPIRLHIFTDGMISSNDVLYCKALIQDKRIEISTVHLYYLGNANKMNLRFTDIFDGMPTEVHINNHLVGTSHEALDDFKDVDYDFIMKDDSFKLSILKRINSGKADKAQLKRELNALQTRLLKKQFLPKLTIDNFYADRDVDGCVLYVKNHCHYKEKSEFQKKMSDIMNLFDEGIDTYSLDNFKLTQKFVLQCSLEEAEETEETEEPAETPPQPLPCEYLTCDILLDACDVGCIPVKASKDDFWPDKKTIQNPFKLLESPSSVQRIVNLVEPYIMDYQNVYPRLPSDRSPFTRDPLKGVYVLHNDRLDVQAMIKHNNYVLSTLFQNKLPGNNLLWHMLFLYIIGVKRFPSIRSILFEEIRFLGERAQSFVTMNRNVNPPIVAPLNACFWYLAHVCPKAFPNSKKNMLRKPDFVSGVFLKFYQEVYEKDYAFPEAFPRWQLCYAFASKKRVIFSILSCYFLHETVEGKDSEFRTILYREEKRSPWLGHLISLKELSKEDVMDLYALFLTKRTNLLDVSEVKKQNWQLYDETEDKDDELLTHVEINLKTCHPYVTCPRTGKYWKECIGPYNREKQSYLRLFRRYCIKYGEYPPNSEYLMSYLNRYVFKRKNGIPEVFPLSLRKQMDRVMKIFEEVMKTYSCKDYLKHANSYAGEEFRKTLE